MRAFVILLAAYLAIIACLPCADAAVLVEHARTTLAEDGHEHPDGTDQCSPLCLCACCGSVAPAVPTILALRISIAKELPFAVVHAPGQRLLGIVESPADQPPRV